MHNDHSPIAIVGLAYRAPGVGRKGLWEFLDEAKSAWSRVPADRFEQEAFYCPDAEKAGCFASDGAHFLPDDVYAFDAPFFNLRAEEARAVDPQHRMLLECALEAAESAGLSLLDIAGTNTGVFTSIGSTEYGQMMSDDLPNTTAWSAAGSALCMFANRLSYFFDLGGPSISVDAACAGSSYAVHLACQSLRARECSAAFVGGSSLLLGPSQWVVLDNMGALSMEGKSYSYDARASGFGRGEGAGFFILKNLADAIESGDPIHAVIRNSACSHSGRSEGITMPRRTAQEKLLLRVHEEIGLNPSETGVVEGHGTGTQVGDPIEAGAFAAVMGSERTPSNPLYIGSLKSNFGHLEGASGIFAMVKAILMIQHGRVLPSVNFETINKNIEGKEKLTVVQTTVPWPSNTAKRVCVANFGFGGSNAAVILEEAPTTPRLTNGHTNYTAGTTEASPNGSIKNSSTSRDPPRRLFVLSAKSDRSLTLYLSSFVDYLDTVPESIDFVKNVSFTLGQRRTHYPYRIAITADSISSLKTQLPGAKAKKIKDGAITYIFTGQGAQYAQMAAGLRRYKDFANVVNEAEKHLLEIGASWSLTEELDKPESESRISDAEISQPACTAIQIALVCLLRSWGVAPTTVTGHSSGEIAAAFAAGIISFRAAMAIAYFRGQAAAQLAREHDTKGSMLALGTSAETASELLQDNENNGGYATIAAINSPLSVTISGDNSAIENIQKIAQAKGLFSRRLKVGVAYHSRHMEQVADSYLASIIPFCNPDRAGLDRDHDCHAVFISSVTGSVAGPETVDASYWIKNLLQPVRFSDAIESVFSGHQGIGVNGRQRSIHKKLNVVIEIGPHSSLKTPIKQTADGLCERNDQSQPQFTYIPSLVRGTEAEEALLNLAGDLFCMGSSIQLSEVNQTHHPNSRVVTDLPPYAWDKSARYLPKSRICQKKLHPGHAYHQLLGWKTAHTEGDEQKFSQVFTLDEIPWIRDHSVAGQVVFPMTGYLSLAMEALRRVTPTVPTNILVREFHAKRSLVIEEDERIEIATKLKKSATGTENFSSTVWAFEILTWSESRGWSSHCHGQIEPEMTEMTMDTPALKASVSLIGTPNLKEHDPQRAYDSPGSGGTNFGPAFRVMAELWEGSGYTIMELQVPDIVQSLSSDYGSPASVHPPTLDGMLQGLGPLCNVGGETPAQMPNYVSRLRVANKIPANDKQRFKVVTRLLSYDTKAGVLHCSVAAFVELPDVLLPVAEWESVTFRTIGSKNGTSDSPLNLPTSLYWNFIPSLDFADSDDASKKLAVDYQFQENEMTVRDQVKCISIYYMEKALQEIAGDDLSHLPHHLSRFVNWAKKCVAQENVAFQSEDEASSVVAELLNTGSQCELLRAVGEALVPILRGEVQPLEIMLKDDMLSRHYENDTASASGNQVLAKCVSHLPDIMPEMHVLEVGAGTASATLPVLQELSEGPDASPKFHSYTFTDISTGFFEKARTKLAKWTQHITYKKLDISQDPVSQGFSLAAYDVVIASNVLHATPNLLVTLGHVRSLLKPNGKLFLFETMCHQPAVFPFALLPGWWLAEDDYRSLEDGPLLPEKTWRRVLSTAGFSGIDGAILDYPGSREHMLGVLWSTRVGISEDNSHDTGQPITICGPLMDNEEEDFVQMVSDQVINRLGCTSAVKPFMEIDPSGDQFCIFIDSPRNSILRDMPSSEAFDALKNALLETTSLLWVIPENHPPEAAIAKGIIRTLRLESGSTNFLLLENVPCTSEGAAGIARLAERLRDAEVAHSQDKDFVWQEGMIHLPRFRQQTAAKEVFASEAGVPFRSTQNIWQGDDASLEMTVDMAGSPDSIYFRRTDLMAQSLSDDDILVRVEAVGVNFRDLLLVLGSLPWTPPGFEGAGIVIRTGSRVTDLQQGDRVFYGMPKGGGFVTHMRVPSSSVIKVPDGISSVEVASLTVAYSTAIMALMRVGRLKKGETVLIHAATGAVGQACIVIAQYLGAEIFATAGTPAKRQFLQETFEIPQKHIFSSRTPEFRDGILCATESKGVDVIVNSLSGNLLQETWSLIADCGRFVELGKRDFLRNSHLGMRPFDRNVTFSAIDFSGYFANRPQELREYLLEIADLLQRGVILPARPVTALPISQLATGLRKLQSGQNIGKIVVTIGPDDTVMAECPPSLRVPSGELLRPDATYIITGGTGGIGIALVPWMIQNGARNVVLFGRSGSSRTEVKELLDQYEDTDSRVRAVACDVGSRSELDRALESMQHLPPVRGVVHGALYLRDSLLMNATYEDWQNITRPRIQGAWNLHEAFPNLDFFISLSSFLGATGNAGQSIYAGTSTFFEAFTNYRRAHGLPATSIALPVVLGVGYVADRGLTESLSSSLGAVLTEAQLQTLMKGAVIGPSSGLVGHDGMALSACFTLGQDKLIETRKTYHPRFRFMQQTGSRQRNSSGNANGPGQGGDNSLTALRDANGADFPASLLNALISKVSSITMIERDDIDADAPLSTYGLDSLISVELRNWIRREAGVDLALPSIVGAENLRALSAHIISQAGK